MILDKQAAFCFGFAPPSGTTAYSTDATTGNATEVAGLGGAGYIDLGATDQFATLGAQGTERWALGAGLSNDIYLEVLLAQTMSDASSPHAAIVTVTLETADNAAFNSNLTTVMTLGTFAAAAVAGTRLVGQIPPIFDLRRYLRLKFTVATAALTAGKFSGFFTTALNANKTYPQRSSII